ncbi:MAG: gamma-glutamyltransferase [Candidatus Acidiferrales bacterium]
MRTHSMGNRRVMMALLLGLVLAAPWPAARLEGAAGHPVRARRGMVVSSHYLASQVGVEILKKGGNAVDAAIATGFALAVTHPGAGNIGGGGFLIARMTNGEARAFDFREKAPAAAHPRMFLDEKGEYDEIKHHDSWLAVGVPGTVAGFFLAHSKLGKLPMSELIAPAVRLAEEGFPLSWKMAADFRDSAEDFQKYPGSAKQFLKDDGFYEADEIWKQPDLARTLQRIQQQGRDGFYKGETARLLAAGMKAGGGLITEADLAAYEAKERTPLRGSYRGHEIISMPPPSSGGAALITMLNILEGYELREAGFGSATHLHLLAEAMRRAFADRARWVGDPEFNPELPLARLTSKEHAANLRARISLTHASVSDAARFNDAIESEETTHYSVMDADGNAVVVTYTIEAWFGSKIVAPGTGFLLNNEMGDFNPVPGLTDETGKIGTAANLVAPGKRMISSMTPAIVVKDGKPLLLIGSPGGRTIINTVAQVIVNVVDFGMDVAEAIEAPRIHHQWLPDRLNIERYGASPETLARLRSMGHEVRVSNSSRSQGRAMGIYLDAKSGVRMGASDPRDADGAAIGY